MPFPVRTAVILTWLLVGCGFCMSAVAQDHNALRMAAGLSAFLFAYVYAQLTKPRNRD